MDASHRALPSDWDQGRDGISAMITGEGARIVVKRRRHAPPGFFAAEATGLAALSAARALRTPRVVAVSARAIALEDLGRGRPSDDDWARAGAALAALHARRGGAFGFGCDGFVGDTPQDNRPEADGFRFFAERRLQPLTRRARDLGMLDANQTGRIDRLCARLADWLPESPAVLVHGDLWLGNLHACTNGELALIDAGAVHYGWAAGDLAMLTLFAAPPPSLFAAYEAQGGIADWRASSPLLNLYPLLNHLCLFGAGYRASVQAVLDRYG